MQSIDFTVGSLLERIPTVFTKSSWQAPGRLFEEAGGTRTLDLWPCRRPRQSTTDDAQPDNKRGRVRLETKAGWPCGSHSERVWHESGTSSTCEEGGRKVGRNLFDEPRLFLRRKGASVSILLIIVIVIVVLALLGFFGRGRMR